MIKISVLIFGVLLLSACASNGPRVLDKKFSTYLKESSDKKYEKEFSHEKLLLDWLAVDHKNDKNWIASPVVNNFYKATNIKTGREELILKDVNVTDTLGSWDYYEYKTKVAIDLNLDRIDDVKQFIYDGGMQTVNLFKGTSSLCGAKQAWSYLWFEPVQTRYLDPMGITFAKTWKTFNNGKSFPIICSDNEPKIFLSNDKDKIVMMDSKKYNQATSVAVIDVPSSTFKITKMSEVNEKMFSGLEKYRAITSGTLVASSASSGGRFNGISFKVLKTVVVDAIYFRADPSGYHKQSINLDLID